MKKHASTFLVFLVILTWWLRVFPRAHTSDAQKSVKFIQHNKLLLSNDYLRSFSSYRIQCNIGFKSFFAHQICSDWKDIENNNIDIQQLQLITGWLINYPKNRNQETKGYLITSLSIFLFEYLILFKTTKCGSLVRLLGCNEVVVIKRL